MPSRRKLAVAVTQKIEALLRTNLDVNEVRLALNKKVSVRHVQRLARRLEDFGTVTPEPLYKQGRARAITAEAQEGIVEFLIEYDKQATIEEVRIFIEEEYSVKASKATVSRAIRQTELTRKVVS
jgi:transposase